MIIKAEFPSEDREKFFDNITLFEGEIDLTSQRSMTKLERTSDDGLKIITTTEDEFGLDSKTEIIFDRFDLEKIKQFIA